MRTINQGFLVATLVFFAAIEADAGLIGTSVTGTLSANGGSANLFDPQYGGVPSNDLNYYGTTVTIAEPATEFGFVPTGVPYELSVNFTNTQMQLFFEARLGPQSIAAFTMTFTDTSFLGTSLYSSSNFNTSYGYTESFSGDTITVSIPGGNYNQGATLQAVYNIASPSAVPEPNSLILLGIAGIVTGMGCWGRRQSRCDSRASHCLTNDSAGSGGSWFKRCGMLIK